MGLGGVSTLHNTWIEALVGTGVVGLTFVAFAFLVTLKRATVEALRGGGTIIPLLLLLVLFVRSATGSTFEVFQLEALLFLWVALSLRGTPEPQLSG